MTLAVTGEAAAALAPADRAALLDAARQPVTVALGKPVLFKVERLRSYGRWAFLLAEMQDAGGRPVSYAGTPLADDAAHGAVSKSYAALLRRDGNSWSVVAKAIGPTDVAWADWAKRHRAPSQLFGR